MMGRDQDLLHRHRAVALIAHHHLGLAIGAEILQLPGLAHLREPLGHPVGQLDGQWHQLGGLVDGEAEHETLVTGAELAIHAVGDVGALLLDAVLNLQLTGGKAGVESVVSDSPDGFVDDGRDVGLGSLADLTADNRETGGNEDLTRNPCHVVVGQSCVEHRIRDGVGHLVGMAFCHRL